MKLILERLLINYPYVFAAILFTIGVLTILTRSNLFKKLIGINIMESAIFLLFVSSSYIRGADEPMVVEGAIEKIYVNPLPSALMLTGIVVSVSVTAFALALIVRLHRTYGTIDLKEIEAIKDKVVEEK
ncbi:MAG TPA: cation:proton antiporter subunit C [Oscillospiraceae bacterium]|nr:cation:proton antiporter subunit C [Oscillospiraceae bacterium]